MCGRYGSILESWDEYARHLAGFTLAAGTPESFKSYNVAPSQPVPAIRKTESGIEGCMLRWGLVPFFAKGVPTKYSTINGRIETIATSPAYRGPWKRGQRCILPASGFYEWHVNDDGTKTPFYIHCADQDIFCFAGLWDRSHSDEGKTIESCTIITMGANPLMAEIHNAKARMPAILARDDLEVWLRGTHDEAMKVLRQYPADLMVAYRVSSKVNSPKNNEPALIAPIST